MNSSGIKRGLAATAVSALAVAGLGFISPASADTVAEGLPAGTVELYTGDVAAGVSSKSDGTNTTTTLYAAVADDLGATYVEFRFNGALVPGGKVDIVDGVASVEWQPSVWVGSLPLTVEAFNAGGVPQGSDTNNISLDPFVNEAVALGTGPDLGELGFFDATPGVADDENYIAVSGVGTGTSVRGQVFGPVAAGPSVGMPNTTGTGVRPFSGVLQVPSANLVDTLPAGIGAARDDVTVGIYNNDIASTGDDFRTYRLYKQAVQTATFALKAGSSANVPTGAPAEVTTWVISAIDQKGAPVAGAEVYEANAAGVATPGNPGTPDTATTNAQGQAEVSLTEAGVNQTTYYVLDVNGNGTYENLVDYLFTATQTVYTAVPTTTVISPVNGLTQDDDEAKDVVVTVTDQFGAPVAAGTPVKLTYTRTDLDVPGTPVPVTTSVTAGTVGTTGKVTFPIPAINSEEEEITYDAFVNNNGDPNPNAGVDAIAAQVKAISGESEVTWDNGTNAQVGNGTTTVQNGKLTLSFPAFNDAPLVGRKIKANWTPTGNAVLAVQALQPAGTLRLTDTVADVVTQAGGVFGVAITDPATPDGQELNGILQTSDGVTDVELHPALDVDFIRSLAPTRIEIVNFANTVDAIDAPLGDLSPGFYGVGYVRAFNADGVQLNDVVIPLSIEEGHFLDIDPVTDVFDNPTVGSNLGEWKSAGQSISVSTGDAGRGQFAINIERNEGFDDDGLVKDAVTAGTGGVTFEYDFEWDTFYAGGGDMPFNQTDANFTVQLAPADEQDSTLINSEGKARANDQVVYYDAISTDQYGNRTSQPISATDNLPNAKGEVFTSGFSNFDLDNPAVEAYGYSNDDQTVTVELDGARQIKFNSTPTASTFDPLNPLAGGFLTTTAADIEESPSAIDWYLLDFDASSFELTTRPSEGPFQAGRSVIEQVKAVDQFGQIVTGLSVEFLRSGPNDQGGDTNKITEFNSNGIANYAFTGTTAGIALITANIYSGPVVGFPNQTSGVLLGTLTDEVEFKAGDGTPDRVKINVIAVGKNKAGKDVIRVNAPTRAQGADAKLQKKQGGKWVTIGTKTLNNLGNTSFAVKDTNGKRFSNYRVKVSGTTFTLPDTSNVVKLR